MPASTAEAIFAAQDVYKRQEHEASVRISHSHTHIVSIRVDGNTLFSEDGSVESTEATVDYALLTVEDICAFADCLDPDDVRDVLDRQIECNTAIAAEGLKSGWGAVSYTHLYVYKRQGMTPTTVCCDRPEPTRSTV